MSLTHPSPDVIASTVFSLFCRSFIVFFGDEPLIILLFSIETLNGTHAHHKLFCTADRDVFRNLATLF